MRTTKLVLLPIVFCVAFLAALPAFAQAGIRLPQRGEPGLDPAFARAWMTPEFDRYGFALHPWREMMGFMPKERRNWWYSFGERANLGMSMLNGREFDPESRQYSLFGRYSISQDWALSAETLSRDPSGLLRLQDFRIGVQRRF